jgi:hypothetical protein
VIEWDDKGENWRRREAKERGNRTNEKKRKKRKKRKTDFELGNDKVEFGDVSAAQSTDANKADRVEESLSAS